MLGDDSNRFYCYTLRMQSILQTKFWADFKTRHGWKAHNAPMLVPGNGAKSLGNGAKSPANGAPSFFILERKLPFNKPLLYAPEVSLPDYTLRELTRIAKDGLLIQPAAIFLRLEIFRPPDESEKIEQSLCAAGYCKAFEETQPEHRIWVDISDDETAILSAMKEKGRYNIRLAAKKGVSCAASTDIKDVEVFYNIFQQTAERDGFQIRSRDYFVDLCRSLFESKMGELIIAQYEGKPLAALIVTYYDGLASYLYGASSNENRQVMASYAAQWQAIKQAKKHNCHTYDLLQVAPDDAGDGHKYDSLTRFKSQFGGSRVNILGGWDYVYRPFWYGVFRFLQKIRRR